MVAVFSRLCVAALFVVVVSSGAAVPTVGTEDEHYSEQQCEDVVSASLLSEHHFPKLCPELPLIFPAAVDSFFNDAWGDNMSQNDCVLRMFNAPLALASAICEAARISRNPSAEVSQLPSNFLLQIVDVACYKGVSTTESGLATNMTSSGQLTQTTDGELSGQGIFLLMKLFLKPLLFFMTTGNGTKSLASIVKPIIDAKAAFLGPFGDILKCLTSCMVDAQGGAKPLMITDIVTPIATCLIKNIKKLLPDISSLIPDLSKLIPGGGAKPDPSASSPGGSVEGNPLLLESKSLQESASVQQEAIQKEFKTLTELSGIEKEQRQWLADLQKQLQNSSSDDTNNDHEAAPPRVAPSAPPALYDDAQRNDLQLLRAQLVALQRDLLLSRSRASQSA